MHKEQGTSLEFIGPKDDNLDELYVSRRPNAVYYITDYSFKCQNWVPCN